MGRPLKKRAKIVKYNLATKALIIELYAHGLTIEQVANRLDLSPHTISRWRFLNEDLKQAMDTKRAEYAVGLIERGLFEAAKGAEEVEDIEKYIEERIHKVTGEPFNVERTIKRKRKAPDVTAIRTLANKYAPNEFTDTIKVENDIRITARNTAMTLEERLELLKQDSILAEYSVDDGAS